MNGLCRDRVMGQIGRLPAAAIVGTLTIAMSGHMGQAQTTPEQGISNSAYTLHVYTDLLQVPTLVLTRLHGNYSALTKDDFMLSLADGPKFHPTNVRLEGDDPMMLAILLDFTTDKRPMFTSFAKAMSTLPAGLLSARDSISVYAYDCELVRTTHDKPAVPDELRTSMQRVLTEGLEKARNGAKQSCWPEKRLYDAIGRVEQDMSNAPGRRVILVISDGADRHSVNDWSTVARFAGSKSITVFGIRPVYKPTPQFGLTKGWIKKEDSDPFGQLCGSSGGLALNGDGSKRFMAKEIERIVSMLRNRYIIEFPRPVNGTSGFYSIDVKIKDPTAIIRPSGVAFPPREMDAKAPGGTIPEDQSKMPVVGAKHQDDNLLPEHPDDLLPK